MIKMDVELNLLMTQITPQSQLLQVSLVLTKMTSLKLKRWWCNKLSKNKLT